MKRVITFLAAVTSAGAIGYGCGSSQNGSASSDAGASDAPTADSPVLHHDAGLVTGDDAGGDDGPAAMGCPTPADVSSWMPPAFHAPKTSSSACTAKDIADYDTACLNNMTRTSADCTAFTMAHPSCVSCLESKSTDTTWGPIVTFSGVINVNLAGCLALLDPAGASCAQKVQEYDECVHTACDGVCAVTSPQTFALWKQCRDTATAQACNPYEQAASCISTDDAGTLCNPPGGFDAAFLAVAPIFCGGGTEAGTAEAGPAEGGTGPAEAGADAPAD
jgi:hypothetical protein